MPTSKTALHECIRSDIARKIKCRFPLGVAQECRLQLFLRGLYRRRWWSRCCQVACDLRPLFRLQRPLHDQCSFQISSAYVQTAQCVLSTSKLGNGDGKGLPDIDLRCVCKLIRNLGKCSWRVSFSTSCQHRAQLFTCINGSKI